MEFTCSGCGLTYCGTPIGSTELCEDCVDNIHKELIGGNNMIIEECVVCECVTEVDAETFICEGCADNIFENIGGDKGMKFIDAIQKYEKITNDGGTTVYSKNSEGTIIMHRNGVGGGFQVNIELLTSEGWEEHKEQKLIVPERVNFSKLYLYIESDSNKVYTDSDGRFEDDRDRFKIFNYFTDKELAQYVADKQLIQRIELVLHELNRSKFNFVTRLNLIGDYIIENFKDVLDRINEYESKSRV